MRRREYDKALAAIDALEKKQPTSALVPNLRGAVYFSQRDLKEARANFEKALALQPDNASAARNLALIDMQEGNPQAARERYDGCSRRIPRTSNCCSRWPTCWP